MKTLTMLLCTLLAWTLAARAECVRDRTKFKVEHWNSDGNKSPKLIYKGPSGTCIQATGLAYIWDNSSSTWIVLDPSEVFWCSAGAITIAVQPYAEQPYIQQGLSSAYYAAVALRGSYTTGGKTYYDGIVAAYDTNESILDSIIDAYIDYFLRGAIRQILIRRPVSVQPVQPIQPGSGN